MADMTYEEMLTPPEGLDVPEWFIRAVGTMSVADNLGDAWDALLWCPKEWRPWVKSVAMAEYDSEDDIYYVYIEDPS